MRASPTLLTTSVTTVLAMWSAVAKDRPHREAHLLKEEDQVGSVLFINSHY